MKIFFFLLGVFGVLAVHSRADSWRITPVPSLQKLTATRPGVLQAFKSTPASLRAAKGEWECFQIVVSAGDEELKNVRLSPTPLATHLGEFIAAKNIQIYRENFVLVDKPSGNQNMQPLWWPDALIPLELQNEISIAPHQSEVFWVAIQAPRAAAAGEYYGAIDVAASGQTKQLFMALNVEEFSMPAPTMRGTVAVYYDIVRDWYSKNWRALSDEEFAQMKKQYYEFLLDYRINAYDLPVAWSTPEAAKYLKDPRVLSVRLPPLDKEEELKTALGVLQANNAIGKNFYYWIDEPSPDDFARVLETTKKLKAINPRIRHCVTVHPNASLQGAVDIWCPNIGDFFGLGHLDETMLAAQRKKGKETWWYTMVEPKYPYPTWLLDDDAQSVRSYGALMARYGISGFVYSMAHGWGPKPLENLQSYAGTNGDGTLVYPSEIIGPSKTLRGPMPSIRLMLLRDAIEDYELMRAKLKPIPKLPNGLLREKIPREKVSISQIKTLQNLRFKLLPGLEYSKPATLLWLRYDAKNLIISFRADAQTFEKDWCAVELAPLNANERFRFVVTSAGKGVVERHTREGRFLLENFDWKFSAKTSEKYYEVEMQIPLEIIGNEKRFRFNALRRVGNTLSLTRAYPDAGDVTLMPIATLKN